MVRKEIVLCDLCEKENNPIQNIFIKTGTYTDAAGDSEPEGPTYEICTFCLLKILNKIINETQHARTNKTCLVFTPKKIIELIEETRKPEP